MASVVDIAPTLMDLAGNTGTGSTKGFIVTAEDGDVDDDGDVDVDDLVAVITDWGDCPGCDADVTCNDVVNVNDLVRVIVTWGP